MVDFMNNMPILCELCGVALVECANLLTYNKRNDINLSPKAVNRSVGKFYEIV